VDLGESQKQVDQRQTGSGCGGESKTGGPKTKRQWTWGRVKDRWTKDKLAVDLGESQRQVDQRQTGSGLGGVSNTNWQWTWGRIKDRWTKDKLAVDLGRVKDKWTKDKLAVDLEESQRQVDQRQTDSGLGGEVKDR
jgi:hypothetical protein